MEVEQVLSRKRLRVGCLVPQLFSSTVVSPFQVIALLDA